ncbi:MAG: PKD domain-containing protein [Bacteroidetes bacterium]|nr:PKD domain-containing protein [Bacteroidota bacterium]
MKSYILYLFLLLITGKILHAECIVVLEDSSRIKITRLNINTAQSDFSPFVINKELYFISARPTNVAVVYTDVNNVTEMTNIYSGIKKDSISFKKISSLPIINSKYNEGPVTINNKGDIIYFSGNEIRSGKNGNQNLLKIYSSKKINNKWTKPELLPFCKDDFSYCHPSISKDGNTLVFSSNCGKGYGGMDLFIVNSFNGSWSKPVNAGNKINSDSNELFPFLSENNILFFSSNRNNGIGGLDIYSFDLNDPIESEIAHLPEPLNSPSDDFGIWVDSTSENGYFSTNRVPEYKDDIYYFATLIPDFNNGKTPIVKNKFCYTFFEETTLEANDTNLTYEWNFGSGQKVRSLKTRHCFNKPGNYPIQLNIVEKNSGEIFYSEASYTLNIEEPEQLYITCCDTINVGKELKIDCERSAIKGYDIEKMYWHFGDGRYNCGYSVKHNFKMSGTYTIQLGVLARNQVTKKIERFKIEKKITVIENT